MKHLLLILFCSTVYVHTTAQQKETIEQYCFVRLQSPTLSTDIYLEVDEGKRTPTTIFFNKRFAEADSAGNAIKFKSAADALNHMGKKGWKLVEVIPRNSEVSVTTYLFKRELQPEVAIAKD
ncbi:MAG: hypothetical protein GXC73_02515 [Chitinophagaceae bacterium]|nr:hypothetical protein [Chitinophagaceae bacterium]